MAVYNSFYNSRTFTFKQSYIASSYKSFYKTMINLDLHTLPIQSYEDVPFSSPKWPLFLNKFFLVQTIIITFIYLLALFYCERFKFWGYAIFGPRMVHLPQTQFFWKIINIILIYLLAPFIKQNFKKILPPDPELWGWVIFGPKMAHFPKWDFFQKTC